MPIMSILGRCNPHNHLPTPPLSFFQVPAFFWELQCIFLQRPGTGQEASPSPVKTICLARPWSPIVSLDRSLLLHRPHHNRLHCALNCCVVIHLNCDLLQVILLLKSYYASVSP